MISYKLIRSNRKTIAIHIKKDAVVEVRAPFKTSKAFIDNFVCSKEQWIKMHLSKMELINNKKKAFSLDYGNTLTIFGKEYPICQREGKSASFDGQCVFMPSRLVSDDIRRLAVQLYKSVLIQLLGHRVDYYAVLMNVKPTAVRVTDAKTRWGSCSGKNSISFSWRLAMADESVIDYVIAHELAHIKEHNHSTGFWAIVEGAIPDYKKRSQCLKILQEKLSHEAWDI